MMSKVVSYQCANSASKSTPQINRPNITYAKPLYYISLITALSCPINMEKYCARSRLGHKIYSVLMIVLVVGLIGFSCRGRLDTSYTFLLQTVIITDVIQQIVSLTTNVFSIGNVLFYGEKYIQSYFDMLKQFDTRLITKMNLRKIKIIFNLLLILCHILFILLCVYDYWTWTNSLGMGVWQYYAFRLYSHYLTIVVVIQIVTFASALKVRFQILNERLFDVSYDWIAHIQSQEGITLRDLFLSYKKNSQETETSGISMHCVLKMHDLLCDVLGLLNEAFGFNTVLLVCNIIVNSVIAFNVALIFGTGVQPSSAGDNTYFHLIALNVSWALFFLTMGVAVARSCDRASKEGWKSATICYKLLACVPTQSTIPKDKECRILLKQLANQIEHRRPEFDACGFFPINHSMLYAIIGAISSYIVIIIQFNNTPIINPTKNVTQT